ncbi:MAG: heme exporter protein CcmD [Halioglobus sp.]|nr:heme exporter protein CcmD [Halioglobus sp.]
MYFDNMQAVLSMGGHGVYVWSAYAVTAVVIAAVLIVPTQRRRRLLRDLADVQRRARGDANPAVPEPR